MIIRHITTKMIGFTEGNVRLSLLKRHVFAPVINTPLKFDCKVRNYMSNRKASPLNLGTLQAPFGSVVRVNFKSCVRAVKGKKENQIFSRVVLLRHDNCKGYQNVDYKSCYDG